MIKNKKILNKILTKIKKSPTEIYVFLLAFLYRLPTLGYDFINNDAFLWKDRSYQFGSAIESLDFAKTAVTYHPGVSLLWSQFIAIKFYSVLNLAFYKNTLSPHEEFFVNHFLQKFVLVIITSMLIALAFSLIKKFIGEKASIIAIVLILLEPFYLGLSRAIHTDVLLSLFMFISFLYFSLSFINKSSKKNLILSGIFLGLAMLTKSSGLFLIPFFGFVSILKYKELGFLKISRNLSIIFGFSLLTFFALWPAMWIIPMQSIQLYLFKGVQGIALDEGHGHIWFGKETLNPGLLFYPIVLISRYSLLFVSLFAFGTYNFIRKYKNILNPQKKFFIEMFVYIVLYFLMISVVSKKLDRYSLPIIFPMAIIGAYYLPTIFKKKTLAILFAFFIFSRAVILYGLHPNYLAYYSQAVGGMENGRSLIEPKWTIGDDKIAKFFNEKKDPEDIKVAIADFDYLRPFAKFEVLNIRNPQEAIRADYFVLPSYREERNDYYKSIYNLNKLNDEITISGVLYYEIYENKGKK